MLSPVLAVFVLAVVVNRSERMRTQTHTRPAASLFLTWLCPASSNQAGNNIYTGRFMRISLSGRISPVVPELRHWKQGLGGFLLPPLLFQQTPSQAATADSEGANVRGEQSICQHGGTGPAVRGQRQQEHPPGSGDTPASPAAKRLGGLCSAPPFHRPPGSVPPAPRPRGAASFSGAVALFLTAIKWQFFITLVAIVLAMRRPEETPSPAPAGKQKNRLEQAKAR